MSGVICTCGLPRYTPADLQRWTDEHGIDARVPQPAWASEICWTKPGMKCPMRPLKKD